MQYLVTGGTGLVGNNVIRLLIERGEQVRVIMRSGTKTPALEGLPVETVPGDVTDLESLRKAMAGVDVLIHAAGIAKIGSQGLEQMRQVNVAGTRNCAVAAREAGTRMVHVSSVNALGIGSQNQPADEEHARPQPLPVPYVISKREAEAVVEEEIQKGLNAVFANPGYMLGPWDWKPSSGRMLLEVVGRFVPAAPWGGHSMCDVRDAAAGMIAVGEKGKIGQRYILAGHNLSFFETWRMFARLCGGRPPVFPLGPVNRIILCQVANMVNAFRKEELEFNSLALQMASQFHYFSSAKAQRELGYQIRPAEETVRDAWAWLKKYDIK